MLIECLVQRVGPTPLFLDKVRYLFMPQPFDLHGKPVASGEPTTSVCEISKPEHLNFMLGYPNTFREYKQNQAPPEGTRERSIDLSGYAITKFQEAGKEGYIVEKKTKPPLFAGLDGAWKDKKNGLFPYPTEYEAWTWLRDEIAVQADDLVHERPEEPTDPLACTTCGKVCASATGLIAHAKSHKVE